MRRFLTIAITEPHFLPDEGEMIAILLEGGIDLVHLRKPEADADGMERLILSVPAALRRRLRLHSCFHLIERYGLAGAHLNSRAPRWDGPSLSRSCHSIEEVADAEGMDYVTLSPVFDSISKQGYRAAALPAVLPTFSAPRRVIALGGVTPDRFAALAEAGYAGAAMLGYLWQDADADTLRRRCREIRSAVDSITNQT